MDDSSTTYIEVDPDTDTLGVVVIALIFSFGVIMLTCSLWKSIWQPEQDLDFV